MLRHYYVADDLNELETVERQLAQSGFTDAQIHVLSERDADLEQHQLHEVAAVLKKDVVRSTERGALLGVIVTILMLLLVYGMGWYQSAAGWMPFVFLGVVILGFCTWEGGFIGIQQPNANFVRFTELLKKGKHILFIDAKPEQEQRLATVMQAHPSIQVSGYGEATPSWWLSTQDKLRGFIKAVS